METPRSNEQTNKNAWTQAKQQEFVYARQFNLWNCIGTRCSLQARGKEDKDQEWNKKGWILWTVFLTGITRIVWFAALCLICEMYCDSFVFIPLIHLGKHTHTHIVVVVNIFTESNDQHKQVRTWL